eukprot:2255733-Prymnesium_polylepis.1
MARRPGHRTHPDPRVRAARWHLLRPLCRHLAAADALARDGHPGARANLVRHRPARPRLGLGHLLGGQGRGGPLWAAQMGAAEAVG